MMQYISKLLLLVHTLNTAKHVHTLRIYGSPLPSVISSAISNRNIQDTIRLLRLQTFFLFKVCSRIVQKLNPFTPLFTPPIYATHLRHPYTLLWHPLLFNQPYFAHICLFIAYIFWQFLSIIPDQAQIKKVRDYPS